MNWKLILLLLLLMLTITFILLLDQVQKQLLLHSVEFNIVPKRGLYTTLELQEFMVRLFPDLTPTTQLNFRQGESCLWFGQLCFSEPPVVNHHDKERVAADLSDRLFSSVYAVPSMCGQMILDVSLHHRRTLVRLFPSRK